MPERLTKEQIAAMVKEATISILKERDHGHENAEKAFLALVEASQEAARKMPTPAPPGKGLLAGRFMRAVAAGKGDPDRAARFAAKSWGADDIMIKVLQASDVDSGGMIVPTQYSTELIELLGERAVFRMAGPRIIPMDTGSVMIPKITGGATASYIGETENIDPSEGTFGSINLTWKKLAAIVPMSNDLLRFSALSADTIVRDDAVAAMAEREDIAFLRGDGSEYTPKGLRAFTPTANVTTATTSYDLAKVTSDLASMLLLLRNGHCRMIKPVWFWAPRTTLYLMQVRDTNGNFAFRDEMLSGNFWGFPYYDSTNVPINLGSGDKSEIQLVDMADVLLGESSTLEVTASDVAAYYDGAAVQSALSRDLTILRVLAHHDLQVRHAESLVLMDGVDWAP